MGPNDQFSVPHRQSPCVREDLMVSEITEDFLKMKTFLSLQRRADSGTIH